MVFAPRSGLLAKTIERCTMAAKMPPSLWPKRVATKPGCRQFAVTPVPARRCASSRVNKYFGELGAPVRGHRAIVLFHLKVVEIEGVAPMGSRCRIDDPCRRRCDKTLAQLIGQHEISHVVERKGAFETVRRQPTVRKDVPCVVDEHVDAGLLGGDAGADLLGVTEGQQVRNMGVVRDLRRGLTEPGQRAFCPRLVAGDEDNPGALSTSGRNSASSTQRSGL
jgi:hypothetical protein